METRLGDLVEKDRGRLLTQCLPREGMETAGAAADPEFQFSG